MFRAASPYRIAGMSGGAHFGGIDARSAMVKGGLIDGLADLSKAFVLAPITRRKNELAAKKQQADDARHQEESNYRKQMLESRNVIRPTEVGRIAVGLHESARKAATDAHGNVDEAKWRQGYKRLRMLQPQQIRDLLPEDNVPGGPDPAAETGDLSSPDTSAGNTAGDTSGGFFDMRQSGAPGGPQTLGDVLSGRWYGDGENLDDSAALDQSNAGLAEHFGNVAGGMNAGIDGLGDGQGDGQDLAGAFPDAGADDAALADNNASLINQYDGGGGPDSYFAAMDQQKQQASQGEQGSLGSEDPDTVAKTLRSMPPDQRLKAIAALRKKRANASKSR